MPYEVTAILIGVLMGPLFEQYFLRALRVGQGDPTILFSSTLGNVLWGHGRVGPDTAVAARPPPSGRKFRWLRGAPTGCQKVLHIRRRSSATVTAANATTRARTKSRIILAQAPSAPPP
jgi:hypothetical protein